jgi:hypothetical protein
MRGLVGVVLAVGLLVGCGGIEADAEPQAPNAGDARAEVGAMGCGDCDWLFVRCMSRATTAEAEQQCEASRLDCQQTFCECPGLGCPSARPGQVQQASACSDACDAKLNSCLNGGQVRWDVCFDRHTSCVNGCGDIELDGHHDAVSR